MPSLSASYYAKKLVILLSKVGQKLKVTPSMYLAHSLELILPLGAYLLNISVKTLTALGESAPSSKRGYFLTLLWGNLIAFSSCLLSLSS